MQRLLAFVIIGDQTGHTFYGCLGSGLARGLRTMLRITAGSVAMSQAFSPGHHAPQSGLLIELGPVSGKDKPVQSCIIYRIQPGRRASKDHRTEIPY